MQRRKPPRRAILLFFVLAALPLLGVFPYIATVNNPNENTRLYLTMAIVEKGQIQLDSMVQRYGWTNDMARVPGSPVPYYASVKAPAVSLAAVPVYWAFLKIAPMLSSGAKPAADTSPPQEKVSWFRSSMWAVRLVVVQLPCFLFLIWLERYLRSVSDDVVLRLSAVAAAGFGTNYLAYTNIFASHALCGVFAFLAFAMTEREIRITRRDTRARRKWVAFAVGVCIGMTMLLEYHAIAPAIVLSLYAVVAFHRPTRLALFALGGALCAAVLLLYQWKAFGNPLTPGHKFMENQAFGAVHAHGIYGIVVPPPAALLGLSFDLGFGFFGTSPFMLLGLGSFLLLRMRVSGGPFERSKRWWAARVVTLTMVALWAISAGFGNWRGGWTVGPRYLAAAPPFFAFAGLLTLEWLAHFGPRMRAIARGIAGGLALASVLTIGTVGLLYDTLPENITRPLTQFAIPMMRAGYVPHHVGEWFGLNGIEPWYVIAAAMIFATVMPVLFLAPEYKKRHVLRIATASLFFAGAMVPAFTKPTEIEQHVALNEVRSLMAGWEPQERDRISRLRLEAERRGPRGPCYWYRLADLERSIDLVAEAERDERRASAPRTQCPAPRWIF